MNNKRVAKEKKYPTWLIIWTAIVLLISSGPYLAGTYVAFPDEKFTGNLINYEDTNSYFADMQLGVSGKWLYTMPYSSQQNKPIPLFMLYILLGHLARLMGMSPPVIYHLARIIFSTLFILLSYRYIFRTLYEEVEQKLAMGIIFFTGGYGWLMILLFGVYLPRSFIPDTWWFDAISFSSILGFPHFVFNMALMLWFLMRGEDYIVHGNWQDSIKAIVAGLGIAFIHGQQLAVVFAVLIGMVIYRGVLGRKKIIGGLTRLAAIIFPASLVTFGLFLLIREDIYLLSWAQQGDTFSPPIWSLFIMYGPVLLFAIFGLWRVVRAQMKRGFQVVLWFLVVLVFLYVPVNFQRRFIEGWQVPLAILAAIGWYRHLLPRLRTWFAPYVLKFALSVLIFSISISPVFLLTITYSEVFIRDNPNRFYVNKDESGAVEYLREHADIDDVVIASFINGNRIPALVGVRSFIGHWSLTPFVSERLEDVKKFYDGSTDDESRLSLIRDFGIRYIYVGQEERSLGAFLPEEADYLVPVYKTPSVSLFETKPYYEQSQ